MTELNAQISYALGRFEAGDIDGAFHCLLDLGVDAVPELRDRFKSTPDAQLRAFLVQIIWQSRDPAVVPFLEEAVLDLEPVVWRESLDGLVALASLKAVAVLYTAKRSRAQDADFASWIDEAIEQAENRLQVE